MGHYCKGEGCEFCKNRQEAWSSEAAILAQKRSVAARRKNKRNRNRKPVTERHKALKRTGQHAREKARKWARAGTEFRLIGRGFKIELGEKK